MNIKITLNIKAGGFELFLHGVENICDYYPQKKQKFIFMNF